MAVRYCRRITCHLDMDCSVCNHLVAGFETDGSDDVALLAFLVLFLIEVFDVRIMSEEDIVNNYTTPLLGTIPLFQSDNRSKRGNR